MNTGLYTGELKIKFRKSDLLQTYKEYVKNKPKDGTNLYESINEFNENNNIQEEKTQQNIQTGLMYDNKASFYQQKKFFEKVQEVEVKPEIKKIEFLSLKKEHTFNISNQIIGDDTSEIKYSQINITNEKKFTSASQKQEIKNVCKTLQKLQSLRDKYQQIEHKDSDLITECMKRSWEQGEPLINWENLVNSELLDNEDDYIIENEDGVFQVYIKRQRLAKDVPTIIQYASDLGYLMQESFLNCNKHFCHERLEQLSLKFQMHLIYNRDQELAMQTKDVFRDFSTIRKVDTHIHHSACMRASHLLKFIKRKIRQEKEVEVYFDKKENKTYTLEAVLDMLNVKDEEININSLEVKADHTIFQRFDRFNEKYNPMGLPQMREIFLKSDNYLKGRYLGELTQEVIKEAEEDKYTLQEWRISVYGKSYEEWGTLAKWVLTHKLYSHNIRWFIQIPRLYAIYKKLGLVYSFQTMLDNIFQPLFEVSLDPSRDPTLHHFLLMVTGFDSVDDESCYEQLQFDHLATIPQEWTSPKNPPYSYWAYYIYANLLTLNRLRQKRNLNTFSFKPHCGESGNVDHLAACFMLADGICHGIQLQKSPVLQYLYYLKQIPIAISPLSNSKLFLEYNKNPFPKFFQRGLNVSLSTDDPLIIHLSKEPLLEEYAVAAQTFSLSQVDLAELARNSVHQSSFQNACKQYWLGNDYQSTNQPKKTALPNIRFHFRQNALSNEHQFINSDLNL